MALFLLFQIHLKYRVYAVLFLLFIYDYMPLGIYIFSSCESMQYASFRFALCHRLCAMEHFNITIFIIHTQTHIGTYIYIYHFERRRYLIVKRLTVNSMNGNSFRAKARTTINYTNGEFISESWLFTMLNAKHFRWYFVHQVCQSVIQ